MAQVKSPVSNPTLTDVMDRLGDDNRPVEVVEVLSQTNEMLDDITFIECNSKQNHKTTVRSGLPKPTWRKLNYGVQPSKSTVKSVQDSCGMLEAFAVIDKKLAEINGMKESWRASEDRAFIEGMNQEVQKALFYCDSSKDPEQIMGLAPRYNTLQKSKAENAENVINAGGTGNSLTSIWVVCWSPNTVHCIYPEGSQAGLKKVDIGEEAAHDPEGGEYRVLKTHYSWDLGLTVRDWRYAVRIANIDKTALGKKAGVAGAIDLVDLLVDALTKIPNTGMGRCAIYCNRTIMSALRKQIRHADNVYIGLDEVAGKKVTTFDGVPIRRVDALEFNEAQVK